jgi:hypothetical protein
MKRDSIWKNEWRLFLKATSVGMIFPNEEYDECGGLILQEKTKDTASSGMSFTMDNYHDDQVIQILNDESYENGKGSIQRGLIINEFPRWL